MNKYFERDVDVPRVSESSLMCFADGRPNGHGNDNIIRIFALEGSQTGGFQVASKLLHAFHGYKVRVRDKKSEEDEVKSIRLDPAG